MKLLIFTKSSRVFFRTLPFAVAKITIKFFHSDSSSGKGIIEIRVAGRNTQGVRIKKLSGNEKVVSVIKIEDNIQ